jgi:hypothetical protein
MAYQLCGRISDVPDGIIVRFEQGAYGSPSADKLVRLADVYSLAQYALRLIYPAGCPTSFGYQADR